MINASENKKASPAKKSRKVAMTMAVGAVILFAVCVFFKCFSIYSAENAFPMWEPAIESEYKPDIQIDYVGITTNRHGNCVIELEILNDANVYAYYGGGRCSIDYMRNGEWFTVYQDNPNEGPFLDTPLEPGVTCNKSIVLPEALALDGHYRVFVYDVGYCEFDLNHCGKSRA